MVEPGESGIEFGSPVLVTVFSGDSGGTGGKSCCTSCKLGNDCLSLTKVPTKVRSQNKQELQQISLNKFFCYYLERVLIL